ncbi:MAG: hypothetical protein KGI51_03560 [Rhodospirillales bacterium]|nr:hypothetical protein [Rhodospirillales bacterium]
MPSDITAEIPAPPIRLGNLAWVALALALMGAVILSDNLWALTFTHIMAGVLWTGIDLFMGFVVGPTLRAAPFPARRAVICRLMPKMLFLLPTLAAITGTAGYVLAGRMGFLAAPWPGYAWVAAALALIALLTVQGLGILLPTNLTVYFELQKPAPDAARIGRLMRLYVRVVALQGIMQVAMIVVMARFATGI